MTGQHTVAAVLAEHYGSLWCPTCGPGTIPADGASWDVIQHQADMLAAAGLLATPTHPLDFVRFVAPGHEQQFADWLAEHDREVAKKALWEAADDLASRDLALLGTGHARGVVTDYLRVRACRVAAREEP